MQVNEKNINILRPGMLIEVNGAKGIVKRVNGTQIDFDLLNCGAHAFVDYSLYKPKIVLVEK